MGFTKEILVPFIANPQLLLERCMQASSRALGEGRSTLELIRFRPELPILGSWHLRILRDRCSLTISQALGGSYTLVNIATLLFLTLWLWRLWRFTLRPSLNPDQPRELPYWIPIIGHTLSFVMRSQKLLDDAERWLNGSREPYALSLAGGTLYIITDPEDIAAVHKNSRTLVFDGYIRDLMAVMDVDPVTVEKLYHVPNKYEMSPAELKVNPGAKHFINLTHDRYISQLSPGPRLDVLQSRFLQDLVTELHIDRLRGAILTSPSSSSSGTQRTANNISLLRMCRNVIVTCNSNLLFGDRLLQTDPDFLENYSTFDDDNWVMLYKMPRFYAKKVREARQKLGVDFEQYLKLPVSERHGAAELITGMEDGMRGLGIKESEIATQLFLVHWSANANGYKLAFWYLAFILQSPSLYDAIFDEVALAFRSADNDHNSSPMNHILNHSPRMEAVFLELLRLTTDPGTSREVLTDTFIGTKKLRAGARLLVPHRQLHLDPRIFGDAAASFDPDRFRRQQQQQQATLARSPGFRPFGGGVTLCPGRFLARQEVLMFVATLMWRYEVRVVRTVGVDDGGGRDNKGGFPRPRDSHPPLGIMGPIKGHDVFVDVKEAVRGF